MSDWREIPGYGGMYQIDRMGHVRSWKYKNGRAKRPHLLVPFVRKGGSQSYSLYVKLTKPGERGKDVKVHNLMRDVWMEGERPGLVVYHKNGDLTDNCLNNLDYITLQKLGKRTGAKARRRPVAKVAKDGTVVAFYSSARAAAKANHMSYQTVLDRCNGKVKNPFALDGHTYVFDDIEGRASV